MTLPKQREMVNSVLQMRIFSLTSNDYSKKSEKTEWIKHSKQSTIKNIRKLLFVYFIRTKKLGNSRMSNSLLQS